ncbi:MAG: DMT family transporter [Candidatus Riflebacteria bacterium]|nr:DMT family transporter [Candidatus Riflebacteria bacterium]
MTARVTGDGRRPAVTPPGGPLIPPTIKLGLLFACFLWAISFIATKVALASIPPLTVVASRLTVSAICFALYFAIRRSWPRISDRATLVHLLVLSLWGTGLHYGTQTMGLQYTTASNGSIYAATCPIFIVIGSRIVSGETVTVRKSCGIALALAGVLTVMGPEALLSFDLTGHLKGDVLVIVSIVLWAVFTVHGKRATETLGALQLLGTVTIMGAIWMAPIAWWELATRHFFAGSIRGDAVAAVAFLGVTCSFLATLLYFVALEHAESQKVGVYLYTIPPMTAAVAALTLREPIGLGFAGGAALVLVGVWITETG